MRSAVMVMGLAALSVPASSLAQKVFLNPSDQYGNAVAGGGNEAQYAKINADLAAAILLDAGYKVVVDQDFYNAPKNANSWGADVFVSIHSNAGGGHGTETLYVSSGGKVLAGHVQAGLLAYLPYQDRGLVHRTDLYVLNKTTMYAALAEVVFHDCAKQTGYQGHPPSESSFLKSASGQQAIANGLAAGICSYFGVVCGGGVVVPPPKKGWFKGVVYHAPDMNERIPGALVVLNSGQSVTASATGYWEFELDPGTYTATAVADGYEPNSSTRTVVAGQEIWGSIGLTPKVLPPEPRPDAGFDDAQASEGASMSDAATRPDLGTDETGMPDTATANEQAEGWDEAESTYQGREWERPDAAGDPSGSAPDARDAAGATTDADYPAPIETSTTSPGKVFSTGACRLTGKTSGLAVILVLASSLLAARRRSL